MSWNWKNYFLLRYKVCYFTALWHNFGWLLQGGGETGYMYAELRGTLVHSLAASKQPLNLMTVEAAHSTCLYLCMY